MRLCGGPAGLSPWWGGGSSQGSRRSRGSRPYRCRYLVRRHCSHRTGENSSQSPPTGSLCPPPEETGFWFKARELHRPCCQGQEQGASVSTALTVRRCSRPDRKPWPPPLHPPRAWRGQWPRSPGAQPGRPQQEGGLAGARLLPRKEPCVAGKAGAPGPSASRVADGWRRLECIYFFNNLFPKLAFLCIAATTNSMRHTLFHLSVVDVCLPSRKRRRKVLVPGSWHPGSRAAPGPPSWSSKPARRGLPLVPVPCLGVGDITSLRLHFFRHAMAVVIAIS